MLSADFKRKGSFAEVVLPGLLIPAFSSHFTGMFRAERESIIKVIYFKEGEIAFASSNQPSDRLGEVLIKRGQLTREQLDMAMSKLEANVSLGRMLVDLGYLSPKELLGGAKTQVEEILFSLNGWREGNYEFVEGPLPPKIVDLKLNTRHVIFQCILLVENRRWVLEQIGSLESVFAPEPDLDAVLPAMGLDPEVMQVVRSIDGNSTVRDLCARSQLDEFTVTKIVAALNLLGLTRLAEAATSGGEFLARFGDDTEMSAEDQTSATVIGHVPESETVPGFAPSFGAEPAGTSSVMETQPGGFRLDEPTFVGRAAPGSDDRTEMPSSSASSTSRDSWLAEPEPSGGPEPAAEGEAGEDMTYEEENLEEEAPRRNWTGAIAAVVLLAALGAGAWYFLLREQPAGDVVPMASSSPSPRPPVAGAGTPLRTASPAAGTTSPAAGTASPMVPIAGSTGPATSASPLPASATPTALAAVAGRSPTPALAATPTATATPQPTALTSPTPVRMADLKAMQAGSPAARPTATAQRPSPAPTATATRTATPVPTPAAASSPRLATPTPGRVAGTTGPGRGVDTLPPVRPGERPTPGRVEATPRPPERPAVVASSGGGLPREASAARGKLSAGQYREAASAYRAALASSSGYTLQLEIVCQDASVKEGLAQASGDEYFILPFTFRGRSCYRAFWGVYPSKAAAASAEKSVPAFFRNQLRGRPLPVVPLAAVR